MSEININEFVGNASRIAERVGRDGGPVIISGGGLCDLVLTTRAEYESRCENSRFFDELCDTLGERAAEAGDVRGTVGHDAVLAKASDIIAESRRARV
jgi:hypothetical protein